MQTRNSSVVTMRTRYLTIGSLLTAFLLLAPISAFGQDKESIAALRQMGKAFASIAEKASPSVVSVKSERTVTEDYSTFQFPFGSPFEGDIFEFFRRGAPQEAPKQRKSFRTAQGSGFIISADGYILTNNHMVEKAESVKIELTDKRNFTAKVIGTDPDSDVAVVKIDAKDLPYLKLANSDTLEVGEWVLAIGNPLGLSHTVTAGIVSATGRNDLGLTPIENFIQTDAAINFGNSGGPLINLDGEVVGINTAIVGAGGNIGIGFAIPVNMAKNIYDQLLKTGTVTRGYLGVLPKDLDADMAKALGLKDGKGAVILMVEEDSPSAKAGMKAYDVVLEVDGNQVETAAELRNRVAMMEPGAKVKLRVMRDGKPKTLTVELGKRPSRDEMAGGASESGAEDVGFTVINLSEDLASRYGYEGESGVMIRSVESGTEAQKAGLVPGMLIKEVNREQVSNTKEFNEAMAKAKKKGSALLLVKRRQMTDMVLLPLKK